MWTLCWCLFAVHSQRPSASWTQTSALPCRCHSAPSMPAFATTIHSFLSARAHVMELILLDWTGPCSVSKCRRRAQFRSPAISTPATNGRPAPVSNIQPFCLYFVVWLYRLKNEFQGINSSFSFGPALFLSLQLI